MEKIFAMILSKDKEIHLLGVSLFKASDFYNNHKTEFVMSVKKDQEEIGYTMENILCDLEMFDPTNDLHSRLMAYEYELITDKYGKDI